MDGIRKHELRQLDAHVAVAVDGWKWVKIGNVKCVINPAVFKAYRPQDVLSGHETMQWAFGEGLPHYSTDRDVNNLLVKRFDIRVFREYKPKMKLKKGIDDRMSMTPVETPENEMVVSWIIRGGRIDETWWDEELVGVCVHVLRMKR